MVQAGTKLSVADNSGAKKLQVIKVIQGYRRRYAHIGDIVTVSVKEAVPYGMVKKGDVLHATLVRTRKEIRRLDGTYLRFNDNAAVIVDPKNKEPKATRVFGPVARELRFKGYTKIISLAPEVL